MPDIREVLAALESIAPSRFTYEFDKVGLQVGDPRALVTSAVVSLDHSAGAFDLAVRNSAQLLLCHHPLIFEPLPSLVGSNHAQRMAADLVRAEVAFIAAHTNWDCARGGVNDALASRLGLLDVTDFGSAADCALLKLVVFATAKVCETVIDAAANAGAGTIGEYRRCAFIGSGEGTYMASDRALPAVGRPGTRSNVPECRIEMQLPASVRRAVETAVRQAHPYEEPAIDFLVMAPRPEQQIGRKGRLPKPMTPAALRDHVDACLDTRSDVWQCGDGAITWVGVVGGAASDEWSAARAAECDALITGEVKQHHALEASEAGLAMVAAGHYATEQPGVEALRARIAQALPDIEWILFSPDPGRHGRPL